MKKFTAPLPLALLAALLTGAITFALQKYIVVELEESDIFLYDSKWAADTLSAVGGVASYAASFLKQFMANALVGSAIIALLYALIVYALCRIAVRDRFGVWVWVLSLVPCLCLMLCLENNAYRLSGHTATLLAVLSLWAYSRFADNRLLTVWGAAITAVLYLAAGPAAMLFSLTACAADITGRRHGRWFSLVYPAIVVALAYIAYETGAVTTTEAAFSPGMFYLWDSTWYMLLYCWVAVAVCVVAATVANAADKSLAAGKQKWVAAVLAVGICAAAVNLYANVHSASSYRIKAQRCHVKNGDWDAILAIDYGDETTPFTSYRLLALAKKDILLENLQETRPFIKYLMENKSLVKKEDQQTLSDMYWACNYMAAARHSAFDVNIVTPGAFNPYETRKLVDINIAYGDYAVAEKLISQLEKTLMHSAWATDRRRFLYNDKTVAADPDLGAKRRSIPAANDYLQPITIGRDLAAIVAADPKNNIARQYHEAFVRITRIDDSLTSTPIPFEQ